MQQSLGTTCRYASEVYIEIAFKTKTKIKLSMHKNVLTLPVSFSGSYTEDGQNFPWQNLIIFEENDVS